jgi:type III pantothenate kinase
MPEIWLIDLGSSRLKWQVRSPDGAIRARGAAAGSTAPPELPPQTPERVWLARVGPPEREQALRNWIRLRHGPVEVRSVRPRSQGPAGLCLDYDERQFGADRYCALLGVLQRSRSPAVVIDAGTAVTVDLLDAEGQHRGGYILPGFRLGLSAVSRLLPAELQASLDPVLQAAMIAADPEGGPGHHTAEALYQGWLQGWAGAIERLGTRLRAGGGATVQWWLTGGDGPALARLLDRPVRLEVDLVLDGLWRYACEDPADPPGRA